MSEKISKEALFNEIKGSLFEFLVAKRLASLNHQELQFLQSIDQNYLKVLGQQDQLVRQYYPEMINFLSSSAAAVVEKMIKHFGEIPSSPKLKGKLTQSSLEDDFSDPDLMVEVSGRSLPISLKLNKAHSFVNTKSGGIKSFFSNYFAFISPSFQENFNQFVDQEFNRLALDLHALNDWDYPGDFSFWVHSGKSELPGELDEKERDCLKAFYARIAFKMHDILTSAFLKDHQSFLEALPPLMGFSHPDLIQVICYHQFKTQGEASVEIHSLNEIRPLRSETYIKDFRQTSSVELVVGEIDLQIRVKPMNKFTTTAIKINCSLKPRRSLS
jgi:hypothetical protein